MPGQMSHEAKAIAALVFVTVAIFGYLAGHGRSSAAPVERTAESSNAAVTITYPSGPGWRPAFVATPLPGISISEAVALAPAGDATRGGLVVGRLLGVGASPLPDQLLAHLRALPNAKVVGLASTQAYRYAGLRLTGDQRQVTLYTVPSSPASTTAIVCYSSPALTRYLRTCEQIAATLTIATGRPQSELRSYYPLTPAPGYGREIRGAIARVDALLLTVRAQLQPGAARATASSLADRLAEGLTGTADSLSAVPPPAATARVHAALSDSLRRASAAYAALAAAVSVGDATAYAAARTEIYVAEAALSAALRDFALLAYD
jgi:hypothetical protein